MKHLTFFTGWKSSREGEQEEKNELNSDLASVCGHVHVHVLEAAKVLMWTGYLALPLMQLRPHSKLTLSPTYTQNFTHQHMEQGVSFSFIFIKCKIVKGYYDLEYVPLSLYN